MARGSLSSSRKDFRLVAAASLAGRPGRPAPYNNSFLTDFICSADGTVHTTFLMESSLSSAQPMKKVFPVPSLQLAALGYLPTNDIGEQTCAYQSDIIAVAAGRHVCIFSHTGSIHIELGACIQVKFYTCHVQFDLEVMNGRDGGILSLSPSINLSQGIHFT